MTKLFAFGEGSFDSSGEDLIFDSSGEDSFGEHSFGEDSFGEDSSLFDSFGEHLFDSSGSSSRDPSATDSPTRTDSPAASSTSPIMTSTCSNASFRLAASSNWAIRV